MEKNNRKCLVCGKEYRFCPSCAKDKNKPSWMTMYDTENCRAIFDALVDYNFGNISAVDAKAILDKCDLTIPLHQNHKNKINKIFSEAKAAETVNTQSVDSKKWNKWNKNIE